jgi:hypothetical protein
MTSSAAGSLIGVSSGGQLKQQRGHIHHETSHDPGKPKTQLVKSWLKYFSLTRTTESGLILANTKTIFMLVNIAKTLPLHDPGKQKPLLILVNIKHHYILANITTSIDSFTHETFTGPGEHKHNS